MPSTRFVSAAAGIGLVAVVLLAAPVRPARAQGNQSTLLAVLDAIAKLQPRKYYLTKDPFTGGQAVTACESGYHMSSLWEIYDPSHLRYDRDRGEPPGEPAVGPPSFGPPALSGWIQRGTGGGPTGLANCFNWTTSQDTPVGSAAFLGLSSDGTFLTAAPWLVSFHSCSTPLRVWCVQD